MMYSAKQNRKRPFNFSLPHVIAADENGSGVCLYVKGEWNSEHKLVLYPYAHNNLTPRTHDSYLHAAREAQRKSNGGKSVSIAGVKGFSTLFEVGNVADSLHEPASTRERFSSLPS